MHNLVFENDQDLQAFDSRSVATQDCIRSCLCMSHLHQNFKVEVGSRGGTKVPMVPTKMDKVVVHLEGATNSVSANPDDPIQA
jgi:hypothetical protein